MLTNLFLLLGGLALLTLGAEGFVRSSARLALRLGISPLVIGLTLVAFGTSLPELVVSVRAALIGQGDIALGNVVGSNICNIGLILGLAALMQPLRIELGLIRREAPLLIGVSLLLLGLALDGRLVRTESAFLLILMGGYLALLFRSMRHAQPIEIEAIPGLDQTTPPVWRDLVVLLLGLAGLTLGARFFVDASVALARAWGVSEAIIGLTIVSLGTSLPELATSLVAAVHKEADIAVGNVIGSNLFNILSILGVAGLIHPLTASGIGRADLAVMALFAALLLPLMRSDFTLKRWEGGLLLLGYLLYILSLLKP